MLDVPTRHGSAGIGIDATEVETMRAELTRLNDAHRRTLDQLATGVAIFTAEGRLSFYNAAYRSLWDLDTGFLDQTPTDSAVLDQLRAAASCPRRRISANGRRRCTRPIARPKPRSTSGTCRTAARMRVVTTPNPQGGVTYLFEDVTERLDMARRYDALIRVQGETLDNLAEAVAVFGSDGRLRLHNPAFADMWRLDAAALAERPHIEAVIGWCRPLYDDDALWRALHGTVTAIEEPRGGQEPARAPQRQRRRLITVPLPDGATLVAFLDVTDTINVERALRERTKRWRPPTRSRWISSITCPTNCARRSPTSSASPSLMSEPSLGPLNAKQREYLGYINTSTNALLAIINDILDLATIDAGAMRLNLGSVDIRRTMHAAAEGIRDRLIKDDITLDIHAADDIGSFTADDRRLRQVLFNLLANAVGFSPPGVDHHADGRAAARRSRLHGGRQRRRHRA